MQNSRSKQLLSWMKKVTKWIYWDRELNSNSKAKQKWKEKNHQPNRTILISMLNIRIHSQWEQQEEKKREQTNERTNEDDLDAKRTWISQNEKQAIPNELNKDYIQRKSHFGTFKFGYPSRESKAYIKHTHARARTLSHMPETMLQINISRSCHNFYWSN